ncbi:MAG: Ig-like domain-containing protein [Clostridia bacterium]|nr:Ig-like domain-containing protein [Clostridia bacterium]
MEYEITLQKTSETTKSKTSVISINENKIMGISGGSVNISVYVSGTYRTSFALQVIRLAESIDVYPKDIQVSTDSVLLNYTLYPIDSTCEVINWNITELDIASISENVLNFSDYGLVHITGVVDDVNMANIEFTIERILPSSENISPTEQNHEMYVGQYLQIALEDNMQFEFVNNEENILVNNISTLFYANKSGNAIIRCLKYNDYNVVIDINEINVTVYDYIRNITLNESQFDYYNGEYITAVNENELNYVTFPTENVKNEVTFEIDSSIAQIIDNNLIFYTAGTVQIKATSIDGNCTRLWKVRYTGGYAIDFELNVANTFEIAKNLSINIEVNKWIPSNTQIKNISIQTLTSDALNFITITGNQITAINGGIVQVLVRVSNNLTKILTINVVENIERIDFGFDTKTITDMTLTLTPTILPTTATIRNVYYVVDKTDIASVNNGILTFVRPGTINLLVFSAENSSINDSCFVTCTGGYPTSIVLNCSDIQLLVNDTKNLFVTSYSPASARIPSLEYSIVSSSNSNIISITNEGKITALAVGNARIKVSVINSYGLDISAYVYVEVLREINSIDIQFEESLNIVNGVYFTAQNNVDFNIVAADSVTNNYSYSISDESIATIENKTVYFKKSGLVTITFTSTNNTSIKKVVSLSYTNNTCISAQVNESEFTVIGSTKQLTKYVGDVFEFDVLEYVPNNLTLQLSFLELATSPNASGLSVATVENNKIIMMNGGNITYRLYINNCVVGEFKFVVIRYATNINVAENEIYVSTPVYNIIANVYPIDSSDKTLTYSSSDVEIAQVNSFGEVQFSRDGIVNILIKNDFANIQKTITIRYTRSIEKIVLSAAKTTMAENSTLTLTTQVYPSGIEGYHIEYYSSDVSIATVDNAGKVISKTKEGDVTITAYLVENHNVTASITLSVTNYITNIALELDSTGDNRGIAGIRVFGREFIDTNNNFYNTYQMNILSIIPSGVDADLIWTSSNATIATVNNTGLVTFVSAGVVTIRVEPRKQFNIARPVYDSYTFKIVDGVNIYNFDQFMLCIKNAKATVFQDNAILTSELITKYNLDHIVITKNVYGNGNMLSLTGLLSWFNKLVLQSDGIVLDNLTFRGEEMRAEDSLSTLSSKNVLMIIWKSKDIVIKNCIFENSCSLIRVYNSKVLLSGCIFRNAGFAHVILSHEQDTAEQTVVTTKNCIFKDALLAAIVFDFDQSSGDSYISKLIVLEGLYIYNFRQPNEMNVGTLLANYVPPALSNIITTNMTDIFSFYNEIKHTFEGKTYYHLGIISIGVNYYLDSYLSKGIVDMTQIDQPNPYREFNDTEIKAGVTFIWRMFTVMPNNTIITPNSTYDSTVYSQIRDNS